MKTNKVHQEMIKKARAAMKNAYSPYSKFKVGACLRTTDNQLFSGCNCENASYSLTLCAETVAIGTMVATVGKKKIAEIVIVSSSKNPTPPCGACRQRIVEFSRPNTKVHLCVGNKIKKTFTISQLLPAAFTF